MITSKQMLYLEWLGYNEYEIEEVETEIKNGEEPLVFDSNQYYVWENGYNMGLKAKINITTISDAPLEKESK